MSKLVGQLFIFLIRGYQALIRPFLIGACKFHPTCSEYAVDAIHRNGAFKGMWLAVRRVMRCHPFTRGGVDLPP